MAVTESCCQDRRFTHQEMSGDRRAYAHSAKRESAQNQAHFRGPVHWSISRNCGKAGEKLGTESHLDTHLETQENSPTRQHLFLLAIIDSEQPLPTANTHIHITGQLRT